MRDFNWIPYVEAAKLPDYQAIGKGALEPYVPVELSVACTGTDRVGTPIDRLNVLKALWQEKHDQELVRRLDVQGDSI